MPGNPGDPIYKQHFGTLKSIVPLSAVKFKRKRELKLQLILLTLYAQRKLELLLYFNSFASLLYVNCGEEALFRGTPNPVQRSRDPGKELELPQPGQFVLYVPSQSFQYCLNKEKPVKSNPCLFKRSCFEQCCCFCRNIAYMCVCVFFFFFLGGGGGLFAWKIVFSENKSQHRTGLILQHDWFDFAGGFLVHWHA